MKITININMKTIIIAIIIILSVFLIDQYKNNVKNKNLQESKEEIDSYSVLSIMIENEDGEYEISKESSWPSDGYVFNDVLSKCENGSQISYNRTTKKIQLKSNRSDRCYVYFDKMSLSKTCSNGSNLATCLKSYYNAYGTPTGLYLHDSTLANGAEDGSYRYAGVDPDNYVCFGSNSEVCPDDNLYRIIGVFGDNVKLIKADYATKELLGEDGDYKSNGTHQSTYKGSQTTIANYYWNYKNDTTQTSGSNNWSTSLLNKVNLNTNYINNIGNVWASKIAMTTWYLGGLSTNQATAKAMYGYERGTIVPSGNPTIYEAKVGLMYPSDYGFATIPSNWTKNLYNYSETNVKNNNWIYLGEYEWTISPYSGSSDGVFNMYSNGYLNAISARLGYGARPVLYLEASTVLTDGEGTKNLPYRIS